MISYQRLWDLMKDKGITTYMLINTYGISANQVNRRKHGADMKLSSLNKLCDILECTPSDLLRYEPDEMKSVYLQDKERAVLEIAESALDLDDLYHVKKKEPTSADPGFPGLSLGHFMKERNLSPRQLSEISGVPLPTIRNLQYGKTKNPRSETCSALAAALGVTVEDFLQRRS